MPDAATYFEPPARYTGTGLSVFLAGGITGCPNWQAHAAAMLGNDVVVFNPRRAMFPPTFRPDTAAADEQIRWEHEHLRRATVVLFWFPESGRIPQPIALYELGFHAAAGKPIAVGAHTGYVRRNDVLVQLELARPDVPVRSRLDAVVEDALRLLHPPESWTEPA